MILNQLTAGAILLRGARQYNGRPYVYGGLDCSKLVEDGAFFAEIMLPRTSEEQVEYYQIGKSVEWHVGDLLFIPGSPIDANPGHVMIYVKPGWVFEAEETGTLVGQKPYDTSQWEFRTRPALAHPMPQTIEKAGLVRVTGANLKIAKRNGYHERYWNGKAFTLDLPNPLRTTSVYVSVDFRKKRR